MKNLYRTNELVSSEAVKRFERQEGKREESNRAKIDSLIDEEIHAGSRRFLVVW